MPRKNSRAANGAGSIRQRADGTWEGRIFMGYNPKTGKPVRKSVYAKTQAEVRKKATEIQRQLDTDTYQAPAKTTVEQWFKTWIETFCENRLKPHTIATYQSKITNHILPEIGALKVQDVRMSHIQKLYGNMSKNGKSPKLVHDIAGILNAAFSTAVTEGLLQKNPCTGATPPKAHKPEILPLSDSDIPAFLKAIEDDPLCNAFALCLFGGLREGELLGLSWKQVDMTSGVLIINQQLHKGKERGSVYEVASTKSGKGRSVALPEIGVRYLKAERIRQNEFRLKAGDIWNNPLDLVFTNEIGSPIPFSTFYKRFKKIGISIGRPDLRPHDLRHTAATIAIASGADPKSVQDFLGHASSSFTLDRYAHASEEMRKATANRMQQFYEALETK